MTQVFVSTTSVGHGKPPVADCLAALDGLDIHGIELGSIHPWQADLGTQIRAFADRDSWQGTLFCHNYFPPAEHDLVLNLASLDEAVRTASIAHARSCIAFAADVGAELYTVHGGFRAEATAAIHQRTGGGFDFQFGAARAAYATAFAHMIESLENLVDEARRCDIALAVETEGSLTERDVLLLERPEEFDALFAAIPDSLAINFNLAHTCLAAKAHGFDAADFIARFAHRFTAVELSHNDGVADQHLPVESGSWVLDWIPVLPDVPMILEFREAARSDIEHSIALVRAAGMAGRQKRSVR